MTKEECDKYTTESKGYTCPGEFCKGNDYVYKYKEQPLCEDIGCEDQKEGRCMTKEECDKYMTESKGRTCIDEFCQGNDCVCKYKEQPLCEDIECKDQKEGEYMTKNNCKQYRKQFPGYTCTDEFCKGNDCVCKYKEQPLCENIGFENQKEGRRMTKEGRDKYMTESKECSCTDDSAPIITTNDLIHAVKLSSNEFRIFLRDPNIERSQSIKLSCKNIIYNHKHSVQVVEKEDINGIVINAPVKSQMLGEKVITSPPTLFSSSESFTKTDHISTVLKVDAGLN